mgnify:CR=1 FL=1
MLSHEVNNTVGRVELAAELVSQLCRLSFATDDRTDFEHAHRRRHRPDGRAQRVHAQLRRRRPAAAAACGRSVAPEALDATLTRSLGAECAKLAGITLQREVDAGPGVPVSMDRSQIEQALLNIAKNGIEAIGSRRDAHVCD